MLEIDGSKRLEITIENTEPVVLTDLTMALLSVGNQYQRFIEESTTQDYVPSSELLIKDVRSGSIVVELVAHTMPILPLIWEGGPLSEWVKVVQGTFEWFTGKLSSPPADVSKQDLRHWNNIVEPVAKDNGSQMIFNASDNSRIVNQFIFNSHQAAEVQNTIQRLLQEAGEPEQHVHRRKVMTWYQTRFDAQSDTGDKAIIEDISKKAVKVIFENNAVKTAMLHGDQRFARPWNELAYIVDVKVQTIDGVPKLYEVLNYYEQHTFDPND
ncbi:MAG: hypothetical protein REI94_08395 [Moraxellaceae bacterium]|nr:hypothetical protein [Moraxellaceae bacterium]